MQINENMLQKEPKKPRTFVYFIFKQIEGAHNFAPNLSNQKYLGDNFHARKNIF